MPEFEDLSDLAPVSPLAAPASGPVSDGDWSSQVTSVAIVQLDTAGNVVGWNPGAERIKGYRAEEVLGSSFTRFYRAEDRERGLPGQLLAIAAARGTVEDNGWRVRSDGSLFWAHVVITALHDQTGRVTGFVKIVTDLTASKSREDAEVTFMRAFAHDFLSPITALRGYVDLLNDPQLGAGDALERISTVTDHLATMMMELSARLNTTDRPATSLVVDAALTVREAAELVLPGDAYGRLHYRGLSSVGVTADPLALRRAMANVVDNAAKYSEGVIDISVDVIDGQARIVVADHGRGIDAADLQNIFEPLERGRLSNPDDGGTGIGLASTKALIERIGGTITIHSVVGVGTSVTIVLPTGGVPLVPNGADAAAPADLAAQARRRGQVPGSMSAHAPRSAA